MTRVTEVDVYEDGKFRRLAECRIRADRAGSVALELGTDEAAQLARHAVTLVFDDRECLDVAIVLGKATVVPGVEGELVSQPYEVQPLRPVRPVNFPTRPRPPMKWWRATLPPAEVAEEGLIAIRLKVDEAEGHRDQECIGALAAFASKQRNADGGVEVFFSPWCALVQEAQWFKDLEPVRSAAPPAEAVEYLGGNPRLEQDLRR